MELAEVLQMMNMYVLPKQRVFRNLEYDKCFSFEVKKSHIYLPQYKELSQTMVV